MSDVSNIWATQNIPSYGLRIRKPGKEIFMSAKTKASPESIIWEIERKTRRKFTAEEKIRIVLVGRRGEERITDLCRREGINPTKYCHRMVKSSNLIAKKSLEEMDVPRDSFSIGIGDILNLA